MLLAVTEVNYKIIICVTKLILYSKIELNTWPRRHVNVEWPERLAKMVADKGDDTRLVHLVHLNAGNEELAEHSAILREQGEAIERMREIYPATIIVKAATAVGYNDQFTHWWATEGEMRHRSLQYIGAFPLMYGGGQNTYVSYVKVLNDVENNSFLSLVRLFAAILVVLWSRLELIPILTVTTLNCSVRRLTS